VPLGVILFDIINNFTSFLHDSQIVLVFPLLEVHQLVISANFQESIVDFGFASDTNVISLLLPFMVVGKELLAHHGSYDEAGSKLVLNKELVLTIKVVLFGVPDGHIDVLFDSNIKSHVLHLLAVLTELIETVLEDEPIIDISKLYCGHICLHEMSIVVNIVLPCFYHRVKRPLPHLLLFSNDVSHLLENL
jgi:hypothetical protein